MRYYKLALPLVILILGTKPITVRAQSDFDAALRNFRQFSDDLMGKYKAENREQVLKFGNEWVKVSFEPVKQSVSYNILLAKSSTVPYVGVLQFAMIRHFTAFHQTKEEAEKDNDFSSDADSWTHRYTFTYQNGAWVTEAQKCEQSEKSVLDVRQSKQDTTAQFGFHDCTQAEK